MSVSCEDTRRSVGLIAPGHRLIVCPPGGALWFAARRPAWTAGAWCGYWNTGAYINNTSGWKVGYSGPVGCKLSTQRPGEICGVTTGGQATSQGSVVWSVSLNANISYGPIDLTATLQYNAPQNVSAGSFVPGNNDTTMTSYLPANDYLQDVGQYYADSFQLVRAASGSGTYVPCGIVFIYNLYNYGASLQGGNPTPYGNPQKDVMTWQPYFY